LSSEKSTSGCGRQALAWIFTDEVKQLELK